MIKSANTWWENLPENERCGIYTKLHELPHPHETLLERFETANGADDDDRTLHEMLNALGVEERDQVIEKIEHLVAIHGIWETFKNAFGMTDNQELFLLLSSDVEGTLLRELKQVLA